MRKYPAFICAYCICCLAQSVFASTPVPARHWERDDAMAAAQSVNIDRAVYEIGDIFSLADGEATLRNLRKLETRDDWPAPARDAAIYQFTRSLAELPRDAIAKDVMLHLQNYQAMTLVPHEDHADALVPLFNIRAAAAGVENTWQREEFTIEAETLLAGNPASLVAAYTQSSNPNQRSGYLDALQYADISKLVAVQTIALKQLAETPALTPVIGVTSTITGDTYAVQQLLINGRGAGLASTLKQIDTGQIDKGQIDTGQFDRDRQTAEIAGLLAFAIENAPASNAALAIAAWWPRLRHDSPTRDLLVELLADPALGSSAALALAQNPDIQTIKILQDTASQDTTRQATGGGESIAARRAQMALDFNRDGLTGELQP